MKRHYREILTGDFDNVVDLREIERVIEERGVWDISHKKEFLEIASKILTQRELQVLFTRLLVPSSREVARSLGLSESYVSQTLKNSINKIKRFLSKGYLDREPWIKYFENGELYMMRKITATNLRDCEKRERRKWIYFYSRGRLVAVVLRKFAHVIKNFL